MEGLFQCLNSFLFLEHQFNLSVDRYEWNKLQGNLIKLAFAQE